MEPLAENVERQGWRDRALQGRIYGRFSARGSIRGPYARTGSIFHAVF